MNHAFLKNPELDLGPVYKLFSTNHKALKITIPA